MPSYASIFPHGFNTSPYAVAYLDEHVTHGYKQARSVPPHRFNIHHSLAITVIAPGQNPTEFFNLLW